MSIENAEWVDNWSLGQTMKGKKDRQVNILLVDDQRRNLYALKTVLQDVPAHIFMAVSGQEALALTLEHEFSLAILDVQMPEMDGYELAEILLSNPSTVRMPIIFVTAAYSDEYHLFRGYEAGAVDYIVKPFEPAVLLGKVRVFLELASYRLDLESMVRARTRALAESEDTLRAVVHNIPDLVLGLDRSGKILFANRDLPSWQSIDEQKTVCIHNGTQMTQMEILNKVCETGEVLEFETQVQPPGGTQVSIFLHRMAPVEVDGAIFSVVQLSRDVTERRRAEEARERSRKIETENEVQRRFLTHMSHEIRTPLNAILGYAQLLKRSADMSAQSFEFIDIIGRSGHHLLSLLNSVLDMAKLDSGRSSLNLTEVRLSNLINDLERMFRLQAFGKHILLTMQIAPEVPDAIRTDAVKIRQILINLIGNALKFTTQGYILLRASALQRTEGVVRIIVEVEDTGPGISADKIETIFEPFMQADGDSSSSGTGLGLTVSRRFACLMGGGLYVESQQGVGSIFRLEIEAENITNPGPAGPIRRVVRLTPETATPTILVLDSDLRSRTVLAGMLRDIGCNVETAGSLHEAKICSARSEPDLVLIECSPSTSETISTIQRIRVMVARESVPIVLVTTNHLEDERAVLLQHGVKQILLKPISEEILFHEIKNNLGLKFVYSDEIAPDEGGLVIEQKSSGGIPDAVCTSLFNAINDGRIDVINQLIDTLHEQNPVLERALRVLANDFKYEEMLAFVSLHRDEQRLAQDPQEETK